MRRAVVVLGAAVLAACGGGKCDCADEVARASVACAKPTAPIKPAASSTPTHIERLDAGIAREGDRLAIRLTLFDEKSNAYAKATGVMSVTVVDEGRVPADDRILCTANVAVSDDAFDYRRPANAPEGSTMTVLSARLLIDPSECNPSSLERRSYTMRATLNGLTATTSLVI
jgi:hypothetical protein